MASKALKSKMSSRSCGLRIWLSPRRFISLCADLPRFGATASTQPFHETDRRSIYEGEIREVLVAGCGLESRGSMNFTRSARRVARRCYRDLQIIPRRMRYRSKISIGTCCELRRNHRNNSHLDYFFSN